MPYLYVKIFTNIKNNVQAPYKVINSPFKLKSANVPVLTSFNRLVSLILSNAASYSYTKR